jgi:hypothetical protein
MTKREKQDRDWMQSAVERLGFTCDEFHRLRRISMTLHRWHELECGTGDDRFTRSVERDEETGKPFLRIQFPSRTGYVDKRYPVADRERGALKRLVKIVESRNQRKADADMDVLPYVQGDPRGAALYLITREQLGTSDINSCYSRGIAIY